MVAFKNEFIDKKVWPFICGFLKSIVNISIVFVPALILSLPIYFSEGIISIDFSFANSLIYSFAFLSFAIFYIFTEDTNKFFTNLVWMTTVALALLILLTSFIDKMEQPLIKWIILMISIVLMYLSFSFIEYDKRNPIEERAKNIIDDNNKKQVDEMKSYSKNIEKEGKNNE